jgi:hypothetical protein
MFSGLSFLIPMALGGLVILPALWWLLKLTPPRPQRIVFPPLTIMADLMPQQQTASHTPWWLLLLRMVAALCAILAVSGPFWQQGDRRLQSGSAPVVIWLENSTFAAPDWDQRIKAVREVLLQARELQKPTLLLTTDDLIQSIEPDTAQIALERLSTLKPFAAIGEVSASIKVLSAVVERYPDAELVWIAQSITIKALSTNEVYAPLKAFRNIQALVAPDRHDVALTQVRQSAKGLEVDVIRAQVSGQNHGQTPLTLTARDEQGLVTGQTQAIFEAKNFQTTAIFELPIDIRNTIRRVEVEGARTAASVYLLDRRNLRQRVGVIQGSTADASTSLLASGYYLTKALSPFADVTVQSGAVADAVNTFLNQRLRVLVLADVGALDPETTRKLEEFMSEGGVLIRFAGSRLALANDALTPVRLRKGGRSFGGALSWDQPKTLAPFAPSSPFANLKTLSDVTVMRQLMAEPSLDLRAKTWASLQDGTPIITADIRGKGRLVLFHVSADPSWSNLPLSGLFVQMLRQILTLAPPPPKRAEMIEDTQAGAMQSPTPNAVPPLSMAPLSMSPLSMPPLEILTGDGSILSSTMSQVQSIKPLPEAFTGRASVMHPAGLYGAVESASSLNVMEAEDTLIAVPISSLVQRVDGFENAQRIDLRPFFLISLIILLLIDTAVVCLFAKRGMLGGALKKPGLASALIMMLAVGLVAFTVGASPAFAQNSATSSPALGVHLAYVLTGDAAIDRTTRAGLIGLGQALQARTSVEPNDPIGLDLSKDETAFYSLIYWPIAPNRPLPSDAAIRRLDAFMKNGGTVIFDTRDANTVSWSDAPTPATQYLRKMLSTLDIPELEPLPRDHVLTRSFYLIEELVGRYATGRTWTEILPLETEDSKRRPVRSGDGISPIIITSNDLTAAWAVDDAGNSLHAIVGGTERQREMALRGGINLMMYALTGNYKADQVHVAPLLERLGQ